MKVITAIDVPLDLVAISFGGEGIEAMALGDALSFLVCELLVLFVVAMIGVDQVAKLADFILQMDGANLGIIEMGAYDGGTMAMISSCVQARRRCGVEHLFTFELVAQTSKQPSVLLFGHIRVCCWGGEKY